MDSCQPVRMPYAVLPCLSPGYCPRLLTAIRPTTLQVSLVAPRHRSGSTAGSDAGGVLVRTIRELQASSDAGPKFAAMPEGEVLARLDAALEQEDFNPPEEMGLDKNAFCKLVALKSSLRHSPS